MDEVWARARKTDLARSRVLDVRLALGLVRHGVSRFATRNVRHFVGHGFAEAWNPLEP